MERRDHIWVRYTKSFFPSEGDLRGRGAKLGDLTSIRNNGQQGRGRNAATWGTSVVEVDFYPDNAHYPSFMDKIIPRADRLR